MFSHPRRGHLHCTIDGQAGVSVRGTTPWCTPGEVPATCVSGSGSGCGGARAPRTPAGGVQNPEMEQPEHLGGVDTVVDDGGLPSEKAVQREVHDPEIRRKLRTFRRLVERPLVSGQKRMMPRFLESPVPLLGSGRVEQMKVIRSRLELDDRGRVRPHPTRARPARCGLGFRAVGFRGSAVPVVMSSPCHRFAIDHSRHLCRNTAGGATTRIRGLGNSRSGEDSRSSAKSAWRHWPEIEHSAQVFALCMRSRVANAGVVIDLHVDYGGCCEQH